MLSVLLVPRWPGSSRLCLSYPPIASVHSRWRSCARTAAFPTSLARDSAAEILKEQKHCPIPSRPSPTALAAQSGIVALLLALPATTRSHVRGCRSPWVHQILGLAVNRPKTCSLLPIPSSLVVLRLRHFRSLPTLPRWTPAEMVPAQLTPRNHDDTK
ncbi:hypothetical protein VTI74DRAFT_2039 [Chaetomium olivicolor]